MDLPYRMYDADNHFYEAPDAFTRHLPASRRDDMFWFTDERGHRHYMVNGRWWNYIPNPTWDPVSRPGSMGDMFAGHKSASEVDAFRVVEPLDNHPEYQDRERRLAALDEQNVEATIMFPTNVTGLEEVTRDNLPLALDLVWSFNQWLEETWGFDYQGRIFTTAVISLSDAGEAVRTLEWALDRGCRAVQVRPAPVPTVGGYRSPGDPQFDPFWARAEESGVLVCSHVADSGYNRYAGDYSGVYWFKSLRRNPLEQILTHGRPIMDYLTALICHGTLARFPELKIVSVENGVDWVEYLLLQLRTFHSRYAASFPVHPVEAFESNVYLNPFWEEDILGLSKVVPVEHILAGSDYPHAEGLKEPTDYVKGLTEFSEADQRRIVRSNLLGLLV
jgi:predicted TIM-barrel fold metal-dependent hydrolase